MLEVVEEEDGVNVLYLHHNQGKAALWSLEADVKGTSMRSE